MTNIIPPEYQARATQVFAVLDALEQGNPPSDWIEQLDRAGVGDVGERWDFSRYIGANGCWIRRGEKRTAFEVQHSTNYNFDRNRKARRFPVPEIALQPQTKNYDSSIVCALQTAARIAFVHKQDKALKVCLDALVEQFANPTIRSTST